MFSFTTNSTYKRRRIGNALQLAAYCWLVFSLPLSAFCLLPAASADTGRKLTLNQVDADNWPNVALNLSLSGPDGKAIPGVTVQQLQVLEDGQPQAIQGLQFGPAKDVAVSVV